MNGIVHERVPSDDYIYIRFDAIFYIHTLPRDMVAHSIEDVRAYRRCPLAYTLGGISGKDGITSHQCLDICLGHAIHEAGNRRILGSKVLLDEVMTRSVPNGRRNPRGSSGRPST